MSRYKKQMRYRLEYAKKIEVLEIKVLEGDGSNEDPFRQAVYYIKVGDSKEEASIISIDDMVLND